MSLHLHHRPFLVVAAVSGAALGFLHTLLGMEREAAVLIGWCIAIIVYAVPTLITMGRAAPESMKRMAERVDESEATVLAASVAGAIALLVGVAWFLSIRSGRLGLLEGLLPLATIVLSWSFIHLMFAVRYAHEFWQQDGGIDFPSEPRPLFSDFLYLSFTIGMTFQTSDVAFTARPMRRIALAQALVSFLFNVVILAAAVNVAAGLLG
ncbi:MAG: DUF1345 domain-containing protein [Acetobacteraceae bacterium]|nr:DUF1345 domain-containing protein [Acetobacteraceae bacterium]